MMENMSPADIKAVTGNDGEGWGGGLATPSPWSTWRRMR